MKKDWIIFSSTFLLALNAMASDNLLGGKSYRLWTVPNYSHSTGESDLRDLTDGRLAKGPEIWRDQATVGWKVRHGPAIVEFDLGEPSKIGQLRFHTVAGRAGTTWPEAIHLYASEDGLEWDYLGDVIDKVRDQFPKVDHEQESSAEKQAMLHWIESQPLEPVKRYRRVVMAVESSFFVFCDEVELIKGPLSASKRRPSSVKDEQGVRDHLAGVVLTRSIQRRLLDDADAITALSSKLSDKALPHATERLAEIRKQIAEMELVSPQAFPATTFPLHPLQSELFALQGMLWRHAGLPDTTLWQSHRFDSLPVIHLPPSGHVPQLKGSLQVGARWNDAFWISNASESPIKLTATLEGKNVAALGEAEWASSKWHDTKEGIPVHSVLEPLAEGSEIELPPGMSTRLWLTFKGKAAGEVEARVIVKSGGEELQQVPLHLHISPRPLPPQELSVVLWDYLDRGGLYGLNRENSAAAKRLVSERFEHAPWASSRIAPKPTSTDFDEKHRLTREIDFPGLAEWLQEIYPSHSLYGIFLIATPQFAGKKLGEPGFEERITAWIGQLSKRIESLGNSPEKFILAAVDEPHSEPEDRLQIAWARAIKAADPRFRIMANPTYARPDRIRYQASITEADIAMPRSNLYQQEGDPVQRYFAALQARGRHLWLYACEGGRPVDVSRYYRKMGWLAWLRGAKGIGFWALGDAGGGSSWNEYTATLPPGTPLFLSSTRATNAIELEALAEGVWEHALLNALSQRLTQGVLTEEWEAAAKALTAEISKNLGVVAYERPSSKGAERLQEWTSYDARQLDRWRDQIITLLEQAPR